MKKKFENVLFICHCVLFLILFSSCQMFTTSLGKPFQRNQKDFLKKASASELLAFSQGPNASNNETVKAVLDLLSEKAPEELKALPLGDKEAALNLTLDATLPMKKVSQILEEAQTLTGGGGGNPEQLVKNLLNGIDTFDTTASTQLLSDNEAMKNAKPDALANAAVAVIVQVAAKNGGYDKIKQNIQAGGGNLSFKDDTADTIVTKMLGASASQEDKDTLKAAVNAAKLLSGAANAQDSAGQTVTRPGLDPKNIKLLGAVPLESILGAF
ncbi:hypothetical protein V1L52_02760 [Treponema sp. HNW]|uniref:hypothetical protein n=1 Tax=Treponema sp. HNW TaxID=3116654 RepID=UPI003D11C6DA